MCLLKTLWDAGHSDLCINVVSRVLGISWARAHDQLVLMLD